MCFWIYSQSDSTCARVKPMKLTGKEGPLAGFLTDEAGVTSPYQWKLRGSELVERSSPDLPASEHLLVLDMMPANATSVCLYEVQVIQGFSEYDETDLVLGCRVLFENRSVPDTHSAKGSFTRKPTLKEGLIFEPLRLTGGTRTGEYRWAKPKMNIGATVF